MKSKYILITLLFIFISGCSSQQSIEIKSTIVNTLEIIQTPTPEPISTERFIETPEIQITPGYCDYDDAIKIIARLDELTKSSGENNNIDQELTEENRILILAAFDEKILELNNMDAPDCLTPSIEHLRDSYIYFKDLFSITKNDEQSKFFEIITLISQEQKLFDEEYQKVKDCLSTGCKE